MRVICAKIFAFMFNTEGPRAPDPLGAISNPAFLYIPKLPAPKEFTRRAYKG